MEGGDAAVLYETGMRHLADQTLLHWYARLDMATRHRLLAVANERSQGTSPLWDTDTLAAVLLMLLTSGAYLGELMAL